MNTEKVPFQLKKTVFSGKKVGFSAEKASFRHQHLILDSGPEAERNRKYGHWKGTFSAKTISASIVSAL
jgi:hypothetical protein